MRGHDAWTSVPTNVARMLGPSGQIVCVFVHQTVFSFITFLCMLFICLNSISHAL